MNWAWLIAFFAGLSAGIVIGVLIDRDTLLRVGRIKIKGRGQQVSDVLDIDLKDLPPNISRRKLRKLERLKSKLIK